MEGSRVGTHGSVAMRGARLDPPVLRARHPYEMAVDGLTIRDLVRLIPSLLVTGGGAAYLWWARRGLSRWAATRESQMKEVGSRVRALLAKPSGVPDV